MTSINPQSIVSTAVGSNQSELKSNENDGFIPYSGKKQSVIKNPDHFPMSVKEQKGIMSFVHNKKHHDFVKLHGRNGQCPCNSGKKVKFCCGKKDSSD